MITNTSVNQKSVCTATWKAAAPAATIAWPIVDPSKRLAGGRGGDERDEDAEEDRHEGAPDRVHVRPEQVVGPPV